MDTDEVLGLIDDAIEDWEIGPDAVRFNASDQARKEAIPPAGGFFIPPGLYERMLADYLAAALAYAREFDALAYARGFDAQMEAVRATMRAAAGVSLSGIFVNEATTQAELDEIVRSVHSGDEARSRHAAPVASLAESVTDLLRDSRLFRTAEILHIPRADRCPR
jgi:hypothetical protein